MSGVSLGLAAGVPEVEGSLERNLGAGELPLSGLQNSSQRFSFLERKGAASWPAGPQTQLSWFSIIPNLVGRPISLLGDGGDAKGGQWQAWGCSPRMAGAGGPSRRCRLKVGRQSQSPEAEISLQGPVAGADPGSTTLAGCARWQLLLCKLVVVGMVPGSSSDAGNMCHHCIGTRNDPRHNDHHNKDGFPVLLRSMAAGARGSGSPTGPRQRPLSRLWRQVAGVAVWQLLVRPGQGLELFWGQHQWALDQRGLSGWSQPESVERTQLCDGVGVTDVHTVALGALHLFLVPDGGGC